MGDEAAILDYAPPPRAWPVRFADGLQWFFLRRPLRPVEVALGAWSVIAVAYAYLAAHRFDFSAAPGISYKPAIALFLTGVLVAGVAAWRLAARRRWRAILLLCLVAGPTGLMAGMLQVERCPHASYVQVLGLSFTVAGDRCGNSRKFEPWWLRE